MVDPGFEYYRTDRVYDDDDRTAAGGCNVLHEGIAVVVNVQVVSVSTDAVPRLETLAGIGADEDEAEILGGGY